MMTCAELRGRLNAYASGTLPAENAAAFEAHLSGCAACGAFIEESAPPLPSTARLPRAVEPGVDLWPAISARLGARRSGRGRVVLPAWLLAAAAVILIVASSGITILALRRNPSTTVVAEPARLGALEAEYAAAAADLTRTLAQAAGRLSPATRATIERNLAAIDLALSETRRALARDPHNAGLEQLVVGTWQRKVELLRRAAALSTES